MKSSKGTHASAWQIAEKPCERVILEEPKVVLGEAKQESRTLSIQYR